MSNCLSIRLKKRPNYEYCQAYRVTANEDGAGAGVQTILCGGDTIQSRWIPAGQSRTICADFGELPTQVSGDSTIEVQLLGLCTDENSSDQDQDIYFDLPTDFSLRETKRLTQLTQVETLTFTYTLGFDLPPTKHNLDLIKTQFNPAVLDNDYPEIEVEVVAGSHIQSEAQLYVKRCNESRIQAELRLSVNHWGKLSKGLLLRDLPYQDVTWGCTLINDTVQNQYPYTLSTDFNDPANLGVWFPWVDYGRIVRDTTNGRSNEWVLPTCYNRPWYYITGLLQRGFCQLGWGFKSPLFESEFGRKLITYIMSTDYGLKGQVYEQRRNNLNVRAESQGDSGQTFPTVAGTSSVWWPQIVNDPVGNMDPVTGLYSACGEVNIRGKVIITAFNASSLSVVVARLKKGALAPGVTSLTYQILDESPMFQDPNTESEYTFEIENVSVTEEDEIGVLYIAQDSNGIIVYDGSFVEFEGVRAYPKEGDTESLQGIISGEYTFLDLLKGLAHNFNIKFKTDFGNRTVEMYQPYTGNFFGETVEGFYIEETIQDIEQHIDVTSKDVDKPSTEQPRYVNITYADTTDSYIEGLELASPLWSGKTDLGEKFTVKEPEDRPNPFFQPTATRNAKFANSFGLHIMKIGGEHEYTYDVGPRIAIAHGNVVQELDNIARPLLRQCTCDAPQSQLIPSASMFSPVKLGTVHNDLNASVEYPLENLVFGVNPEISAIEPATTLYDLVYRRWLIEQLNNLKINYLVDLNPYRYWDIDFRKVVRFMHMGRPIIARIQEVRDYRYCERLYTSVEFVPQRQLSDICNLLPITDTGGGEGTLCENNPSLLCENPIPGRYLFVIGGQNNAPISNTFFEYSTDGGTSWTPITNTSPVSAELNPISVAFIVRATVTYSPVDGVTCDSIALPEKPINPCPTFNYNLECDFVTIYSPNNPPEDGVRVITDVPQGGNITVVSSQYSIENGALQPYGYTVVNDRFVGDSVAGGDTLQFFVTIRQGLCDPLDLTKECILEDNVQGFTPPDCADIQLNLFCVEGDPGCFTFERSGLIFGENDNYIKYQCSDDGINYGPWMLWDEVTPVCCSYIRARWWAVFCEDLCPTKCSSIIECVAGCEPFMTGTVPKVALCSSS